MDEATAKQLLEPASFDETTSVVDPLMSIAISMKRIADQHWVIAEALDAIRHRGMPA